MKKLKLFDDALAKLRHLAEERLQDSLTNNPEAASLPDEVHRLIYELSVQHIELEIQQEELLQSRNTLELLLERYTDLYDYAPRETLMLGDKSEIVEVNLPATKMLGDLFDNMLNGYTYCKIIYDDVRAVDFIYEVVNTAFLKMFGFDNPLESKVSELIPGIQKSNPEFIERLGKVATFGIADRFEIHLTPLCKWFELSAYCPKQGHFIAIFNNITERKCLEALQAFRLSLFEMEKSCSVSDLIKAMLDEAERLTGSSIGCYHFIKDDYDQIWSNHGDSLHQYYGYQAFINEATEWVDELEQRKAFIHNDVDHIQQSGLTIANPFIKRTLTIPVIAGDAVTAIIWVCNKPHDYDDEDVIWVSALADIINDAIARKRAEELHEDLQSQLQQSQKMELIGQLAGGIAHDFNNMLGIILGHTEICLYKKDLSTSVRTDLDAIQTAAKRTADLTRQLLAFARKQITTPKILDLNETVKGSLSMLKRLIGEDISLDWIPKTQKTWVKIDPSQIDQILVNLCINSRDALAYGGKITIETDRICLKKEDCESVHYTLTPGTYITLAVTDNGSGIEKKYQDHIFEPFFTTKEVGKGTGLGLSTVYGIVKQNNGFIECKSISGKGTMIKISLPLHNSGSEEGEQNAPEPTATYDNNTILLCEDQPDMLRICQRILENNNYNVISAENPKDAIRIATQYKGVIDLLITDVVMPEMSGINLAIKLKSIFPDSKTLFMSGYSFDIIPRQSEGEDETNFIMKPFTGIELIRSIQKTLNIHQHPN